MSRIAVGRRLVDYGAPPVNLARGPEGHALSLIPDSRAILHQSLRFRPQISSGLPPFGIVSSDAQRPAEGRPTQRANPAPFR